jgi:hypothetical protein
MVKCWAVKCGTCEKIVELGEWKASVTFIPERYPIPCPIVEPPF